MKEKFAGKCTGSLLGTAVGDILGAGVLMGALHGKERTDQ